MSETLANSNNTGYVVTNLVSNNPNNSPQLLDPYVSLGWGIAIRPAGLGGHFWINNSGTGTVTEYVGDVGGVPIYQDSLKVVTVTPTEFNPFNLSGPTGQVFNGSDDFVITQEHPNGDITAPSKFIFVASDGGISAWTERRNDDGTVDRPLESEVVVDNLGESIYYGAAITNFESDNRLYAVDFGPTPGIEVYDASFTEITDDFEFANPFIDEGYAPYNIQNVNDSLFVAYAIPSPIIPGDEVIEPGLGRVAEFDLDGNLIDTWDDNELLNAPWGFVAAPDNFGDYSNMLLVSNFGDGTIVAFDPDTQTAVDYLRDDDGEPIVIDGLWGLVFGNGGSLGETNDLYFAAGNDIGDNPGDGVFGRIEVATDVDIPAPGGDQVFDGTADDDLFVVDGDNNTFSLGAGNDIITARGLEQTVNAGSGDDIISIGSGIADLGDGNNFIAANAGSSIVMADAGDDTVNLVMGTLTADVGEGNNHVTSGAGDDDITAGSGDDIVYAGAGNNTLNLGEGNNTVNTIVVQGNFLASVGQTTVTTGSGSDTFRLGAGEGIVTITNFDVTDRFELIGFKPDFSGALSFSDVVITQDGADTVITLAGTDDMLANLENTQADTISSDNFGAVVATVGDEPIVSVSIDQTALTEGEAFTLSFDIDGEIPEGGLDILVDADTPLALFEFAPVFDLEATSSGIAEIGVPNSDFSGLIFNVFESDAFIRLQAFDEGAIEGDETFEFTVIDGEGFSVNPDASSATLTISDGPGGGGPVIPPDGPDDPGDPVTPIPGPGPEISFEVIPDSVSEEGSLQERTITLQYTIDGEIPEGGQSVLVAFDGDFATLFEQGFQTPVTNIQNLAPGDGFFPEINAFEFIFTDNVASFDSVLENDLIQDEDITLNIIGLLPDPDGLLNTPYTVNPDAVSDTIFITDELDGFPTDITVGFTADTTEAVEGEGVTLNFTVEGDIPTEGVTVALQRAEPAQPLALDLDPSVFANTPAGFAGPPVLNANATLLTLTEPNASITLILAEDGLEEGTETISLSIPDGELYEIDAANSSVVLSVSDATGGGDSDEGNDTIGGSDNDDTLAGGLGNDVIEGGGGNDVLRGDLNSRSPQDDVAGGNDIIFGGDGSDRIGGKAGNDILSGDAGDDFIWGDDGDDILMGVTGNDILVGDNFSNGSGSDTFVFGNGDGTDTILDFEVGIDRIGLVEGELLFTDLTITQDGGNTLLGVTSTSETLAILENVQASALGADSFVTLPDVSDPSQAAAFI